MPGGLGHDDDDDDSDDEERRRGERGSMRVTHLLSPPA
jgi:hypothetical protein